MRLKIGMNRKKYDEELVEAFVKSAGDAFFSLKENHKEQFYYFAFIFDEGMHPYIPAWSYEVLEKSMMDNKITEEEKAGGNGIIRSITGHCG